MIPLPKEFTCAGKPAGKSTLDYLFFLTGLAGAIISLLGLQQSPAQVYFVIGSSLLLLTAVHYKVFYFIAFEIILIAGHGATLLGINAVLQFALPVFLCIQLLIFYLLSTRINYFILFIGVFGIAVLSIGFIHENQWIFFAGSSAVAIFAFHESNKHPISFLWAVLNCLFALTAIWRLSI